MGTATGEPTRGLDSRLGQDRKHLTMAGAQIIVCHREGHIGLESAEVIFLTTVTSEAAGHWLRQIAHSARRKFLEHDACGC